MTRVINKIIMRIGTSVNMHKELQRVVSLYIYITCLDDDVIYSKDFSKSYNLRL